MRTAGSWALVDLSASCLSGEGRRNGVFRNKRENGPCSCHIPRRVASFQLCVMSLKARREVNVSGRERYKQHVSADVSQT